jgi:hypothetical protein
MKNCPSHSPIGPISGRCCAKNTQAVLLDCATRHRRTLSMATNYYAISVAYTESGDTLEQPDKNNGTFRSRRSIETEVPRLWKPSLDITVIPPWPTAIKRSSLNWFPVI